MKTKFRVLFTGYEQFIAGLGVFVLLALAPVTSLFAQQASDYRNSVSVNLTGLIWKYEVFAEHRLPHRWAFGLAPTYFRMLKHEDIAIGYWDGFYTYIDGGYTFTPYAKLFLSKEETEGFYVSGFAQLGSIHYVRNEYTIDSAYGYYPTYHYYDKTGNFFSPGIGGGLGFQYAAARHRLLFDVFIGLKYNALPASFDKSSGWTQVNSPGSIVRGYFNMGYCFK